MEEQDNKFIKAFHSKMFWLVLGVIGIWAQFGYMVYFDRSHKAYPVVLRGGYVSNVGGVDGTVTTTIDGVVNTNLYQINGHRDCFYGPRGQDRYYKIPIVVNPD